MSDEEITSARAGALLAAAVQGVAWALIENETDTADRGVSEEYYRDAVQRAQNILPTLLPGVVAEEPEWEYRAVACELDGDIYDSTGPAPSQGEAIDLAAAHRLLDSNPDMPALVIATQRRRKAGPWVPVKQEGADDV